MINKNRRQVKTFSQLNNILNEAFLAAKSLTMNLMDYCRYYVSCLRFKKRQQIKESMKKVADRLDIIFVLQKLVEIDKLKILLLNQDQRQLFDFLPKPIVQYTHFTEANRQSLTNIKEEWSLLHQEKTFLRKAALACYSYSQIMQKEHPDPLDVKLINMIDDRIIKVFNIHRRKKNHSMVESSQQTFMHFKKIPSSHSMDKLQDQDDDSREEKEAAEHSPESKVARIAANMDINQMNIFSPLNDPRRKPNARPLIESFRAKNLYVARPSTGNSLSPRFPIHLQHPGQEGPDSKFNQTHTNLNLQPNITDILPSETSRNQAAMEEKKESDTKYQIKQSLYEVHPNKSAEPKNLPHPAHHQ